MTRKDVVIGMHVIRKAERWNSGAGQKRPRGIVVSLPQKSERAGNQYQMEVDFDGRKEWVNINHFEEDKVAK